VSTDGHDYTWLSLNLQYGRNALAQVGLRSDKTGQMNENSFRVKAKATKAANCVPWMYKEVSFSKF